MKNIYLYGASDDLHELDSDCGIQAESSSGLKINDVFIDYKYDGDWKINLKGEFPPTWIARKIEGTSEFIHIQVPDNEDVKVYEPGEETETKLVWKQVN